MENSIDKTVYFRKVQIENLDIFYREAGACHESVILFLHGFPSSSHMYRDILADLAHKYHVIVPDYPGFGLSSSPSPAEFSYTFDHLAAIMEKFIDRLDLQKFSLFMQDYGGPIGFRIASNRPDRIHSLIIQNANAYNDGLGPDVLALQKLQQADDYNRIKEIVHQMVSLEGIKGLYLYGAENPEKISPDSYLMDHFFVEIPGNKEIQVTLFENYKTNFPLYDSWQSYLRTHQPPTLIVWGKNDKIFTYPGAQAYLRDVKEASLYLLEGGHFVLEEHHQKIAGLIDQFLSR